MSAARSAVGLVCLVSILGSQARAADPPAQALFPVPFLVEHHAIQTSPGDSPWQAESVTSYHGGSWIVSVRADGSRTLVDLARREVTEVQAQKGTYWTLSFGRMAELRQRLAKADEAPEIGAAAASSRKVLAAAAAPRVKVDELSDHGRTALAAGDPGQAELASRPGVRHLRASFEAAADGPVVDAWVDGRIKIIREAREALLAFEKEALDGTSTAVSSAELISAVRDASDGAIPVRTRRTAAGGVIVEDVATRLESIAAIPQRLLTIPDSFKRVPSPLEAMVSFAEEEASHRSTALGAGR